MVDSGAECNSITRRCFNRLRLKEQRKSNKESYKLFNYDQSPVNDNGGIIDKETRELTLQIQGHSERIILDIIDVPKDQIILGMPWLETHDPEVRWKDKAIKFTRCNCKKSVETVYNWRNHILPISEKGMQAYAKRKKSIYRMEKKSLSDDEQDHELEQEVSNEGQKSIPDEFKEFECIFGTAADLPQPDHKPWDHRIDLQEGKQPTFGPVYQCSQRELEAMDEYLREAQQLGWIRPSTSSAGYPILFVKKKGTDKLRVCVDYRQLNNITIKDRYPLPRIDEMFDRIQGSLFFSKLDLVSAYHRIRIAKGHEWKTAFRTKYGLFEYLVMPFGLTNAPATFQRFINNTIRDYLDKFAGVYLDDILIYSKTREEHVRHVRLILNALKDNDLFISLKKSEFFQTEINFLGHIIGAKGIRMEPEKVQAILEWPEPKNLKELQGFTATANYYRRHIKDFSSKAEALTKLTKKDVVFKWDDDQKRAFQLIKETIAEEPVLAVFDPAKPIYIETDASEFALGAVLYQKDNEGRLHPIAFLSKKFSDTESRYPIHDKELMAIVQACKQWRAYLEGANHTVTVYSDHKNLTYFLSTKDLNKRQVRWWEKLSSFDLDIIYTPGKDNARADALSRRPDHFDETKKKLTEAMLIQHDDNTIKINRTIAATFKLEKDTLSQEIKEAYKTDIMAQHLIGKQDELPNGFTIDSDSFIRYKGKIYITANDRIRKTVIHRYHDAITTGHPGIGNTVDQVSRYYYFPGMRRYIDTYVNSCDTCIRTRSSRHKGYGQLTTTKPPKLPYEEIAWDFITELPHSLDPTTKVIYDSIFVITDKLTKKAHFVPFRNTWGAEQVATTIVDNIFRYFGMPAAITSDRDKRFMAKYFKTICATLGIKQKLSSAHHPQTDGQTERLNQTLEQYLRCYVDIRQNNWVQLLPIAEFAYNSKTHTTTNHSPFYAHYGYEPTAYLESYTYDSWSQQAKLSAEQLKILHQTLSNDIQFLNERMAHYYDKKHQQAPKLEKGDKVYLLRKNIKTNRPSNKLDFKKLGPFMIQDKINDVTFRLNLPKETKIHNVFHVSLLEPAPKNLRQDGKSVQPEIDRYDDNEEDRLYEVEDILDSQRIKGELHYLIQWKGYSHDENSWEPRTNINADKTIRKFHQRNPAAAR